MIGIAIGLLANKHFFNKPIIFEKNASITFHSYGDNRILKSISAINIWRWYYLRNTIVQLHENTNTKNTTCTTILFINFDAPVIVGTLEISSSDFKIPTYEVKEFNNRFAIIVFSGEVPAGSLHISVK